MINNQRMNALPIALAMVFLMLNSCAQKESEKKMEFESIEIANNFENLWANCPADVNGDKIADVVVITDNAYGGTLGYFEGTREGKLWEFVTVVDSIPGKGAFAMGDMEVADMDFDGDMDLVAGVHSGEWKNGSAPTELYWFENPSWESHYIGTVANFIKDISLNDLNNDQKRDVLALTYDSNSLRAFQQQSKDSFDLVLDLSGYGNLHEGMDVGDLNGDGFDDVFANGHIFYNPSGQLTETWSIGNLDERWNNQEGDWSKNGTKTCLRDIDRDGVDEIFISHSERAGYPLAMYKKESNNHWQTHIIRDSIPACHTMQVFDFNGDGHFDILTGVNMGRAINIGFESFPVMILLGDGTFQNWSEYLIDEEGIYNGQAIDFDADGDMDIFRLKHHGAQKMELLVNKTME